MSICFAISDADWTLTKDVFSIIGTVVSAAAVAVAFYFGREGLHTWRRQLRGSADHDLSRRLLIELYRFRNEIQRARSPAIFTFEGMPFEGEAEAEDAREASFNFTARAYRRRMSALDDARNPLLATMLEAEAVWGGKLKELMAHVFKLEREFVIYVQLYLRTIDPSNTVQGAFSHSGILEKRRNVLYHLDSPDDSYWNEMMGALNQVEQHLREHLIPA